MSYINVTDFFFLLFFLLALGILSGYLAKKKVDRSLHNFFWGALALRLLGSILYALVYQYYYGYGDTFTFFKGGNFYTDRIAEDISNFKYFFAGEEELANWYKSQADSDIIFAGYFSHPSGNMVMKISALLSYISFNRYIIIGLFFGYFSFWGQWKLFEVFHDLSEKKNSKLLGYLILYTPSVWFWGSGLLKDSICIGCLGFILYFIYKFIKYKKRSFRDILLLIFFSYLLWVIKPYILVISLLTLGLCFFLDYYLRNANFLVKFALLVTFVLSAIFLMSFIDLQPLIESFVADSVAQINSSIQNYGASTTETSKGGFAIAELDPTLSGVLTSAPGAIFRCFYRPFMWEAGSVMILLTALESTLLLLFTLKLLLKTKVFGFFRIALSNPFYTFCLVISILFALIIGLTTFNFGTLVRYKIILLPFFYFLHTQIHFIAKKEFAPPNKRRPY